MADELREIREKQQTLVAQAREHLDKAGTDEARAAEHETAHDAAMQEFDKLEKRAKALEKMLGVESRFKERMDQDRENRERNRPAYPDIEQRGNDDDKTDKTKEYRSAFAKLVAGYSPADLAPEERALLNAGHNQIEQRMQTANVGAAGGYTVPTTLADFIDFAMKANGPMYDGDVCTVLSHSTGGGFDLPTIDDTSKVAGAHAEGNNLTDDGSEDVAIGRKQLGAFAYDTEFVKWSWILDQDGIHSMEEILGDLLGQRMGRTANGKLTVGSGVGEPAGVVGSSSLGVTTASSLGFTFDEIIDLEHSVNSAYRKSAKAAYMLSDGALKAARKLKNAQGDYLWQAGNVQTGAPAMLNGYKYHINDDMAGVATGNRAILFGDFGKYYVRKVGNYIIAVLRERFWPNMGIAGLVRFDGALSQAGAIKHLRLA